MLDVYKTYVINPAVDVYKIGNDVLEFYFINTRRRVTMKVSEGVISLVHALSKPSPLIKLLDKNQIQLNDEIDVFINYLQEHKILYIKEDQEANKKILSTEDAQRYDRQINYFESVYSGNAYKIQNRLNQTKVVIFGVGAIGAGIAQQLAMSGVRHFTFVDKDIVSKDSIERHFYYKTKYIGMTKTEALSLYLKDIDENLECTYFNDIIDYDTSLSKYLTNVDLVINTLDEPYIGITSLKIGRECYKRNIPLYVAGGFDAHLMSTGELIVPKETPCVDCYTEHFTRTLKDWKPQYNTNAISNQSINHNIFEVGGLSSMSLFSISYATMVILNFLATKNASCSKGRGELLFENLEIKYLNIPKNPNCHVCGQK